MNAIIKKEANAAPAISDFKQDIITRWILFLDATPKTVQTYSGNVKHFFSWLNAHGIARPTRQDVISFRDDMSKAHKPTTVNAYLAAIKQLFKWTEQEGIYPNITVNVKALKLDKGFKKDYLTSNQVKRLLSSPDRDTLKGARDYALILLMTTTGLRTVEVMRANIEDIRTVGDFTALYIQGKGHAEKGDCVKLTEPVEKAIRAYLKARGTADETAPLFTSISHRNEGGRMTTQSISRIVKSSMRNIDLDSRRLTAHSLRHTAATLSLLNGATVEQTRQMLRHSSITTTMIYSHAIDRASNDCEDRVTAAILG